MQRHMPIAKVGEIPVGRTKTFRFGVANGIAINQDGVVKAYVNRCTHMGGPVELAKDRAVFRCRWHEAEFDVVTGEAIEGEAPRGTRLQSIEIITEGDQLFGVLELPDDPFAF